MSNAQEKGLPESEQIHDPTIRVRLQACRCGYYRGSEKLLLQGKHPLGRCPKCQVRMLEWVTHRVVLPA